MPSTSNVSDIITNPISDDDDYMGEDDAFLTMCYFNFCFNSMRIDICDSEFFTIGPYKVGTLYLSFSWYITLMDTYVIPIIRISLASQNQDVQISWQIAKDQECLFS